MTKSSLSDWGRVIEEQGRQERQRDDERYELLQNGLEEEKSKLLSSTPEELMTRYDKYTQEMSCWSVRERVIWSELQGLAREEIIRRISNGN